MKIIVYVLDGLRADHLSCYGYERNTSPEIDRLAVEGCVFENAFAQSTWTRPSAVSLLTSCYPGVHGIIKHNNVLPRNIITLPGVLRDNGFRTIGITAMANLATVYGFDNGFDEYYELYKNEHLMGIRSRSGGKYYGKYEDSTSFAVPLSEDINDQAFALLDKYRKDDLFMFLWSIDTHIPFAPPEAFRCFCDSSYNGNIDGTNHRFIRSEEDLRYWIGLYDSEIRYNDYSIGRLIEELKSLDLYEETSIFITADHGEGLDLSRKRLGHGGVPYDHLIHVPLVVKLSHEKREGMRVRSLVQLIDLFPTIVEIAGHRSDELPIQGRSVLPLLRGDNNGYQEQQAVYAEFRAPRGLEVSHRAIRTREWKLIHTHFPKIPARFLSRPKTFLYYQLERRKWSVKNYRWLFNVSNDHYEAYEVSRNHPEIVQEQISQLYNWQELNENHRARMAPTRTQVSRAQQDAKLRKHLEELGYID